MSSSKLPIGPIPGSNSNFTPEELAEVFQVDSFHTEMNNWIHETMTRFSSLQKLLRVTARFWRIRQPAPRGSVITVPELWKARIFWLRKIQEQSYPE
jgi:hypothetical protein